MNLFTVILFLMLIMPHTWTNYTTFCRKIISNQRKKKKRKKQNLFFYSIYK